ncbi:MAG: translation initiation factor IF-2 subunit beta [Candidatus Aenigmarchaeota archaeon]|nr:translation initiation factor IF-2 subunit beta [Candidatus Aenigmarchaeota archaeon]
MDDYEQLLKSAMEKIPHREGTGERFEMPRAQAMISGQRTIITNFKDVADKLRRDPKHLQKFLLKELATSGELEPQGLVVLGNFSSDMVNRKLDAYVKAYVLCPECKRPDTRIIKEDVYHFLKCEACGAKHPVSKQ